jgi:hypothetical protein
MKEAMGARAAETVTSE